MDERLRWSYPEFFQRYRVLAQSKDVNRKDLKKSCTVVLPKLIQDADKWRLGKSKIFFRAGQVAYLEKLRADKLRACGIMIQKHVRGWLMKKKYMKLRISALGVQRYGRGLLARRLAQRLRENKAATKIQKVWKGYKTRKNFTSIQKSVIRIQAAIRGYFGRRDYNEKLRGHKAVIIQSRIRAFLVRKQYKKVMYGVVKIQGHFKRRKAKAELRRLKIEAKSVDHIKSVAKGLENKIIQLQQQLDQSKKVKSEVNEKHESQVKAMHTEMEKLKAGCAEGERSSNRVAELEEEVRRLTKELDHERSEKQDLVSEKEQLANKYNKELDTVREENLKIKEDLDAANKKIQEQQSVGTMGAGEQLAWEEQKKQMFSEMESERQHHQRLVKEHNRVLQRFENMQGEMQVLKSPTGGHHRTPSDISMISIDSSVSPDDKKDEEVVDWSCNYFYGHSPSTAAYVERLSVACGIKSLSLGPDAKIEATMQHEITRLTSENLDLRELIDKQAEQIRKLMKMLKVYVKRLKEGEDVRHRTFRPLLSSSCSLSPTTAAEIQAELEQEETNSVKNVAQIKHRERNYMGMLEYKKEDEGQIIKALVIELKPRVAAGLMPGLPAYLLFMCVRHTDYINDDEKVRSFLTSTINNIKKVVKKHHDDLDRVTMLLANTCRFLHTLKQYSGEKQFQAENTPRQNEHCLRNFDLGEYRQVFSDLAVWIYQTLIKLMEATIQPSIVAAVLDHEAIAGLTGSKPGGMRGRSSSVAQETPEHSLDSLMKSLNHFVRVLSQHAVDPELVKQIFRQLYYFLAASALNNLLLRKDMCNWSKGMQIRYNLSHLEQWLRDNKLQESGAGSTLDPIIQASQLLQARKTDADVDSVCDMCFNLTVPQIVKILNLYTPVDEFEERVPISFIRKIQQKLKMRPNPDNALLMDLKFSFSVTFPFNPSKIALETIEVPDILHVGKIATRL